ncbi:exodeoxyribonuclease III [candidate division KSB1 bacterium]|nr:MAG: exodeoxyribonuclease III [candidate division KSB1 bacterium]
MLSVYSWNVNGIRAWHSKGLIDWVKTVAPDIFLVQETKAHPDQLAPELINIDGYKSYFASAKKRGYSGVALYTKSEPQDIEVSGNADFDDEGRILIAHYDKFSLMNCYFPNSQPQGKRLEYKLSFCDFVLDKCNSLVLQGKNVVLCGDFNIAHTEIDLQNPKSNQNNPGFLPEEREWMSKFLNSGYTDSFRKFHPGEPGHYTWWSYRFNARAKDIGWRIDYICVNNGFQEGIIRPDIHKDVMGSDHCPVSIELDV